MQINEMEALTRKIRGKIVEMSNKSQAAHLGSALSCVDILVALYWDTMAIDPLNPYEPQRDRFILSKGHAAMALFATLAARGFFPELFLDRVGSVVGAERVHGTVLDRLP